MIGNCFKQKLKPMLQEEFDQVVILVVALVQHILAQSKYADKAIRQPSSSPATPGKSKYGNL